MLQNFQSFSCVYTCRVAFYRLLFAVFQHTLFLTWHSLFWRCLMLFFSPTFVLSLNIFILMSILCIFWCIDVVFVLFIVICICSFVLLFALFSALTNAALAMF